MEDGSITKVRPRRDRAVLAGVVVLGILAVAVIVAVGRDGTSVTSPSTSGGPRRTPVPSMIAPPSVAASTGPVVSQALLDAGERAVAAAYLELAESFDKSSSDIQISGPLAEFDLVGTRLIDLLDRTGAQVAGLPSSARTAGAVHDLADEMTQTTAMLRAIDPHGPRDLIATRYLQALDYWIDHVKPAADALRATLGLPPTPAGDLRL